MALTRLSMNRRGKQGGFIFSKDPSMEQTAMGPSTTKGIEGDLSISKADRPILCDLASRVAELATRPVEQEKAE